MPPILIDQKGDQLIFQNEDGTTFPVASSGLSPDYMSQISSGAAAPSVDPKMQMLNQIDPSAGKFSSVMNPGPLTNEQQGAWSQNLLNRGPEDISPEELESYNQNKGMAPSIIFPSDQVGFNVNPEPKIPADIYNASKSMGSELGAASELGMAPSVSQASAKEEPSRLERSFNQMDQGIKEEYTAQSKAAKEAAQNYQEAADTYLQTNTKLAAANELGQRLNDRAMGDYNKANEELKQMDIKDPWAEMSTGSRIGAALAIGLGAYSSAINGGVNQAYKIIDDSINRDIAIQQKKISKKMSEVGEKKDYLDIIRKTTSDKTSQIIMEKDVKLGAVENKLKKIESTLKSEESLAKLKQMRGELASKRDGLALDYAQRQATLGKTIAETSAAMNPAKNLTDANYDAAKYGKRAQAAEDAFRELNKQGFDRSSWLTATAMKMNPEALQFENMKRQNQAERNFLTAVLRKESGATIQPSEFETGEAMYFDRAGDTAAVKEQKRQARELQIQSLLSAGGGAVNLIPDAPGQRKLSAGQKQALIQEAKDNLNNPDPKIAARAKQIVEAYR